MRRLILICLAAAACGQEETVAPSDPTLRTKPAVPAQPRVAAAEKTDEQAAAAEAEGKDAAATLRTYYDHLEAGRYREAWAMRSADSNGYDRFERNFETYRSYQVTLGTATRPVEQGGFAYVEVPIQILGTLKSGKGFGSVGSVTMRRAVAVAHASRRERRWHIYTG